MWIDSACNFGDLSFGDDIMPQIVICDSNNERPRRKNKISISNFGTNKSRISIPPEKSNKDSMHLYTGVFNYLRYGNCSGGINCLTHAAVKNITIDLGSSNKSEQFTNDDLQFIGKVMIVAAFIELPNRLRLAREGLEPVPFWRYRDAVGHFDRNDNGGDTSVSGFCNGMIKWTLEDDHSRIGFLEEIEEHLALVVAVPRSYKITRGDNEYTNKDMAKQLIMATDKVRSA